MATNDKNSADVRDYAKSSGGVTRRRMLLSTSALAAASLVAAASTTTSTPALAQGQTSRKRPNILVIWGDDIGWQNVSAYGMGTMGYTTPNIDRIGKEGLIFTDHYGQPSCTAGRAAFITGQYPIRSGMTTVGQPGAPLGLQAASPCLAEVMKAAGYRTGQFGKNHLGDRNEHLPTVHGFDVFYGNLYHLNTQEEAEQRDYQRFGKAFSGNIEEYEKRFGTRGVLSCKATSVDDPTTDPRFGKVGKQTIEDTGPLTQERMKAFDIEEVIPRAISFMEEAKNSNEPFFIWLNTSRMHLYTRLNDQWRYAAEEYTSEADFHGSGMLQHDHDVGVVLDKLEELGLADDTIIWYSTDNGPEHTTWPYGATTPFRGEKMTTYEGGVRVASMLRWPAGLPKGKVLNGIQAHQDMFTTLSAAAGVGDIKTKMEQEKKQFLDGVDNLAYWKGDAPTSGRDHIFHYYESKLTAVRMAPWKFHFSTKEDYYADVLPRTVPLVFNIRMDPFESYSSSDAYGHLMQKVSWLLQPMGVLMQQHLKTLADYPPVQGGASFDMSNVVEQFMSKAQQ